jgi:GNAT superfamily N-acetyltransferase
VTAGGVESEQWNVAGAEVAYTLAMNYRGGRPEDLEAIVGFQIAMAKETEDLELDGETCRRGVSRVFEDTSLGSYYVAEEEGRVVGSLLITFEWSDWRAGTVWWIQSVYVEPALRGRGAYRGLYEHVRALARNVPDVRGIRLYVDRRNSVAQNVYARLGMDGDHYVVFEWMKE